VSFSTSFFILSNSYYFLSLHLRALFLFCKSRRSLLERSVPYYIFLSILKSCVFVTESSRSISTSLSIIGSLERDPSKSSSPLSSSYMLGLTSSVFLLLFDPLVCFSSLFYSSLLGLIILSLIMVSLPLILLLIVDVWSDGEIVSFSPDLELLTELLYLLVPTIWGYID